jgi:hypothetical protein
MTDQQTVLPPARPQRPHSIKNLVPRLPERGRIAIGMKGEMITSKAGNQFQPPQKLDHFRVVTLDRGKDGNFLPDEAFYAKYGAEPTEIPVRLIYDDPDLSFQTRYGCYIGRTLWCSGDGETATRLTPQPGDLKKPGVKVEPREVSCTCHRQAPDYQGADRCRMNGSLSVLIEDMGGVGGVWKWRTTSFNSILGVMSSLAFLRSVTGGILANIPLVLRVQPKQAVSPTNQQAVTIYIVSLEFAGTIAELQKYAHQIALDRATTRMSIEHIEEEARRLLAIAGPPDAILSGDNPDDVVEEFFPEQVEEMLGATPPPRPTREQFETKPGDPPHDPTTGEIIEQQPEPEPEIDPTEMLARSLAAARDGVEAFRAFWAKLSKPERGVINDDREKYQRIAEKADDARKAEAELAGEVVQDEPGAVEPDEAQEPTWIVPIPKGKDGKSTNWPALRDNLIAVAEECKTSDDLAAFEEANAATIETMKKEVAVYANNVTVTLAACRQRLDPRGK